LLLRSLLRSLLNYLNHTPPLARRKRTRLDDPHFIANCRAEFIMGHELRRATHVTTILAVTHEAVYTNHDGLLHLVGRYRADFLRSVCTTPVGLRGFRFRGVCAFGYSFLIF